MPDRIPAEVFSPGEYLREELEAREWTQEYLAHIMGRSTRLISQIITGQERITAGIALELSVALGTTPELWLNLDSSYQLSQVKQKSQSPED